MGPAPTLPVNAPVDALSATASVRGGISSPSGGCPMGTALCGSPVGHSALFAMKFHWLVQRWIR